MEITKKAEYAVRALVELALHPNEYISSKEIAQKQGIPPNFLPQIIATLGANGWVEGVRGPGGGIRLLVSPEKITVKEVIEVIEGPVAITRCLVSNHSCDQQVVCPLHDVWERAQNALLDVLGDTKISDVASARIDLERQLGG